jgi:hypothetical protein
MSNWALLVLIRDGWFKTGAFRPTADAVPLVALVLFLLAATMAAETARAVLFRRAGPP